MKVVVYKEHDYDHDHDVTVSFSRASAKVLSKGITCYGDLQIMRDKEVVAYFPRGNWDWYEVVDA